MSAARRRSDPVENLNSYVMVHGGIDRHDRLLDVEWIRRVIEHARHVCNLPQEEADAHIDALRVLFREGSRG